MPNKKTHVRIGGNVGTMAGAVVAFHDLPAELETYKLDGYFQEFTWQNSIVPFLEIAGRALAKVATGWCCGHLGAAFPDVFEPAQLLGPNHRGFAHSGTAGVGLGFLLVKTAKSYFPRPRNFFDSLILVACLASIGGAISHLVLDAETPRGLPVLCQSF